MRTLTIPAGIWPLPDSIGYHVTMPPRLRGVERNDLVTDRYIEARFLIISILWQCPICYNLTKSEREWELAEVTSGH